MYGLRLPNNDASDDSERTSMKLTGKIVLMYTSVMVLLTICYGYSIALREYERLTEERTEEAVSVALAMEQAIDSIFQEQGHGGLDSWIRRVDTLTTEMSITWVVLDSQQTIPNPVAPLESLQDFRPGEFQSVASLELQHTYYPIYVTNSLIG